MGRGAVVLRDGRKQEYETLHGKRDCGRIGVDRESHGVHGHCLALWQGMHMHAWPDGLMGSMP